MNPQPNSTADRIFAPNVYVFAYALIDGSENPPHTHPLWEYGDKIMGYFTDEKITDNLDFSPDSKHNLKHNSNSDRLYLIPEDALSFTSEKYPGIEGFAQPQKIKDSYALWLNIGYSDENEAAEPVPVDSLKQLNPNHVLSLPQAEEFSQQSPQFLGQTLLITAWLTTKTQQRDRDYLRSLADQCCQSLLGEYAPQCDREGELFASPIFAYSKPTQKPTQGDKSPHVLVWLFRDEKADRQYNEYQQELIALFLYRSKIIKAFQNSRLVYDGLDGLYRQLENSLDRLQTDLNCHRDVVTNDDDLKKFKTQLKTFATESLPYTRFLRKMEDFHNTIDINLHNYNQIIEQICAKIKDDGENLSFLRDFGQETAPLFRRQIKADLGYFQHGTDLINTAIASIRGIVEIDQAERDRIWQRLERKRNKRLQEQLRQQEHNFLEKLHQQDQQFQEQLEAQLKQQEKDFLKELQSQDQQFQGQLEASREENETENQKLQDLIGSMGVGIAVGAIVASSSGLITQPWYLPNGKKIELSLLPHPFFIALFLSALFSLLAWCGTKTAISIWREKGQNNNQEKKDQNNNQQKKDQNNNQEKKDQNNQEKKDQKT